ncbi:MAG: ABC transporter [Proteobacteria bacterium]|nr:MAG: ABC transporter [Pseudomonadota bacterium]
MISAAVETPTQRERGPERPALELRQLSHRYGKRLALDKLDLRVSPGSVVGLLGPNGSGKSTALSIIAGLLPLQEGEVLLHGQPLHRLGARGRALVGVVFQQPSLDAKLTARQNLNLYAMIHGLQGKRAATAVDAQLAAAELEGRADDPVKTFSGGMRRRLDIARALLPTPPLLLLDEPTAGLDEVSFRQLWRQLETLRKKGQVTILLSTHRPDEAERCDLLAVLAEGRPQVVDTPEALRARVAHDTVAIIPADPREAEPLLDELRDHFKLPGLLSGNELVLEHPAGHELIPRVVERYPGRLASVALRRPTVGDVFLKITGQTLDGGNPDG